MSIGARCTLRWIPMPGLALALAKGMVTSGSRPSQSTSPQWAAAEKWLKHSFATACLHRRQVPGLGGESEVPDAILATGPAPTRSELEDIVLDLILQGGLEHPDVNVPLTIDGRRVIPDFRWPRQRLIVEADSAIWHDGKLAREDDAERQALLEASGERLVRVTWQQAVSLPGQTLTRMKAAGAPADIAE